MGLFGGGTRSSSGGKQPKVSNSRKKKEAAASDPVKRKSARKIQADSIQVQADPQADAATNTNTNTSAWRPTCAWSASATRACRSTNAPGNTLISGKEHSGTITGGWASVTALVMAMVVPLPTTTPRWHRCTSRDGSSGVPRALSGPTLGMPGTRWLPYSRTCGPGEHEHEHE
mmetsp:Transcript_22111/g.48106  ORF Transcript_22111/g.48106 Transcript_22111/m.48106 type:complete len:173 (+) Transcript_22111:131-649(+)